LKEIVKISRPRFWLYTAGPYLLGYAASSRSSEDLLSFLFLVCLLYFLIPSNFYLYGINDLFDRDTDIHNPKKGSKEVLSTDLGVGPLLVVVVASLIISLVMIIILQGVARLLMGLYIALSTLYSTPPARLKTRPLLDSYSNSLYALPMIIGYAQNAGVLPRIDILIASIAWTASMHAFSAIPDIEYDRRAGLKTIAVWLGLRGTLIFCAINWAIASLIAINYDILLIPSILYPAIPMYLLSRIDKVEKVYWLFPYINGIMGFLAFLYVIYRRGFI